MAVNKGYEQYKQNSILNAPPEELTLMLYNGCIRFMKSAISYIDEKKPKDAHENIIKSQNIIMELNNTLNMQYDISKDLRKLYTFILERLLDANVKKEKEPIEEVIPIVENMRDTWKEAMVLAKTQIPVSKEELKTEEKKLEMPMEAKVELEEDKHPKEELEKEEPKEENVSLSSEEKKEENLPEEPVTETLVESQMEEKQVSIPKPNMNRLNTVRMNAYKKHV